MTAKDVWNYPITKRQVKYGAFMTAMFLFILWGFVDIIPYIWSLYREFLPAKYEEWCPKYYREEDCREGRVFKYDFSDFQ